MNNYDWAVDYRTFFLGQCQMHVVFDPRSRFNHFRKHGTGWGRWQRFWYMATGATELPRCVTHEHFCEKDVAAFIIVPSHVIYSMRMHEPEFPKDDVSLLMTMWQNDCIRDHFFASFVGSRCPAIFVEVKDNIASFKLDVPETLQIHRPLLADRRLGIKDSWVVIVSSDSDDEEIDIGKLSEYIC